jgi:hypothetical protein
MISKLLKMKRTMILLLELASNCSGRLIIHLHSFFFFRYLLLPLIDAERAWAYAMQLKSEANTEPRKRFHLISRLRKAVQHADLLDRLCNESGVFDARTKLEVQVCYPVITYFSSAMAM